VEEYGALAALHEGQLSARSRRSGLGRTPTCKLTIRQHCGTRINEDDPDVVGMLQNAQGL